ncbi:Cro/CI family transcriptional regulator [Yersinia kristensenii]|uniref:Cro/CI family transcriptional regulator n=2 Tax=Yersiniaceae TaxID=1903411 RepID=UPI000C147306|nr:Cro/CI family transcriptional regulator [Yersinia kristensenii]MDA5524917.1 Cro/CI family transcriptional regulator [Yersinia kristensenii]PHZ33760.1 Cro/Cl family transcriptional regulator [Yersinia kristensenii]
MKKSEAIKLAGGKAKLARMLRVTKAAVSQWGEQIPELRELQLDKILRAEKQSETPK